MHLPGSEGRCHVIGEKPMAASMAEARRMVRTAEETRLYGPQSRAGSQDGAGEPIVTAGKLGHSAFQL